MVGASGEVEGVVEAAVAVLGWWVVLTAGGVKGVFVVVVLGVVLFVAKVIWRRCRHLP